MDQNVPSVSFLSIGMFSAAVGAAGTSKDPFVYSTAVGERETEMTDAVFRGMERT